MLKPTLFLIILFAGINCAAMQLSKFTLVSYKKLSMLKPHFNGDAKRFFFSPDKKKQEESILSNYQGTNSIHNPKSDQQHKLHSLAKAERLVANLAVGGGLIPGNCAVKPIFEISKEQREQLDEAYQMIIKATLHHLKEAGIIKK